MTYTLPKMTKITKISEAATPDFKSAKWKSFVPGKSNPGVSLPLDYTVTGTLISELKKGGTIFMNRVERNGISAPGIFMSSVIVDIKKHGAVTLIETRNSLYLMEEV